MSYLPNTFTTQYTGVAVPDLGTVGNDLLRINDVDPNFTLLNDGSALLYRIMMMFSKDTPADQPQYWFFEDDQYAVKTTCGGTSADDGGEQLASDGTTLWLADNIAVAGSVIVFPKTGELALVTANSSGALTITRGYQGTEGSQAAMDAGDEVVLVGATLEERGTAKDGIAKLPTKVDNYVSFFSQSVSSSSLQEVTNMLNGVAQKDGEFAKMTLHVMRQMDFHLRHSRGSLNTNFNSTGKAAYYTKGLEQYVTTNAELPLTGLTWYDFNEAFNDAFLPTNSSPSKTLVCSQNAFSRINKVCFDRWTANPAFESTLGATMGQIALDSGNIVDVVLDKYGFTTQGKQAYLLDFAYMGIKPMSGFELNWRDITLPTDHGSEHEIFGSTSLWVKLPGLHRTVTFAD